MKSSLAVIALGLAALVVQGALTRAVPPPWTPDLAWLVVVGLGLRWPGFVSGFVIAALLGFAMDAVSGSLIGQHALLRIATYLATALVSRQLDLSGGIPIAFTTFVLSLAYAVGIVATRRVFLGAEAIGLETAALAVARAFVDMLCAVPVVAVVERIVARFADEEIARRSGLLLGHAAYGGRPGRGRP